jgi:hypothetical protein
VKPAIYFSALRRASTFDEHIRAAMSQAQLIVAAQ